MYSKEDMKKYDPKAIEKAKDFIRMKIEQSLYAPIYIKNCNEILDKKFLNLNFLLWSILEESEPRQTEEDLKKAVIKNYLEEIHKGFNEEECESEVCKEKEKCEHTMSFIFEDIIRKNVDEFYDLNRNKVDIQKELEYLYENIEFIYDEK
jgi:hypothetical protein